MKKLSVVIPVYNEEKTIRQIIDIVKRVELPGKMEREIIVVNDGSGDDTLRILKELKGVKVVNHLKNRGKGAAIRTGIKHVKGDVVIIQDADLEYDPNYYKKLVKPIINGKTKVVYGSRFLSKKQKKQNIKFLKKKHIGSYWANYAGGRFLTILANLLYRTDISDEATCYKVFEASLLKSLELKCNRFEFCPEVTAKVRKRGEKIYEIPVSYKPRTIEEGKKINWKDGVGAIWTLIKYRFIN